MKKSTYLIIILITILSCKDQEKSIDLDNFKDFTLILETKEDIDSVLIMDLGQQRENYKVQLQDTITINFKDSINDLYNVWFYKNGKIVSSPLSTNQFWLKGDKVLIKGKIDKGIVLDTIIGSDLYYASKKANKKLKTLSNQKVNDSVFNQNYLSLIENNIDNPFSLALASQFINRNQNKPSSLKKLKALLRLQDKNLKSHPYFRPYQRLNKILKVEDLDFSKYQYFNSDLELSTIQLDKDKKYIIDFWFVNCAPCIKDHKYIATKKEWLKENNVELIGISKDKNHELFNKYLSSKNYDWKNYREEDNEKSIRNELDINTFPTYLIIENGTSIVKAYNSFEEVEKFLSN